MLAYKACVPIAGRQLLHSLRNRVLVYLVWWQSVMKNYQTAICVCVCVGMFACPTVAFLILICRVHEHGPKLHRRSAYQSGEAATIIRT